MVRRPDPETTDHDERIGEAIEAYLALAESGQPPAPEAFAARYPGLEDDLLSALEGLALVQGLVGDPGGPAEGARLESGRRIAGYRIVRELGRGGMGVVYEAVHVGLDRPVALKVLGGHAAPDSTGRRRFLNEARTAAGLHHTHIVPVFDVGQVGGLCYYAMQRIEGSGLDRVVRHLRRDRATGAGSAPGNATSLRSRLGLPSSSGRRSQAAPPPPGSASETGVWDGRPGGPPSGPRGLELEGNGLAAPPRPEPDDEPPPFAPPRGSAYYRWVAEVGREAAEALGHAHRRGVIHRDVKPSNLLVDGRGLVWVADFGLARRLADPGLTQHDSLLGTPRYMSPEQARVGPIDGRTDLYSLGATLYELLTLRPPFEGRSAAELIGQIADREPAPPRQTDPRLPRDLETIVLKLLGKRPADRYATAAEVAEDLTRFLNFEPVHARRISPVGRLWRFARRHPGLSAVSTAAAVAVTAVTTVAYVRIMQERDQAVRARAATQAAMRTQLWREASVVRMSNVPNRRPTGLGLIQQAAALKPEPALATRLRDEAVEFLVLRDVAPRPGFPAGGARSLAFSPDGGRLLVLTRPEGADTLSVWDVDSREPLARRPLQAEPARPAAATAGNAAAGTAAPRGRGRFGGTLMAAAGPCVAVVAPGGPPAVRFFDAVTGAHLHDLTVPGRRALALAASTDGRRLVTASTDSPGFGPGRDRTPPPEPGARPPAEHVTVHLWDPARAAGPLATLAHWEVDRAAGPPGFPLLAVSPDGKVVATARAGKTAVALWSAESGAPLGPIETQSELTALALGPDSQLATAGGGEVRLWDVDSRASLPTLTPNESYVRALRFSPRGSLLAVVGGMGRGLELWDAAAHTIVAALPTPEAVDDAAFAPDGRTLVASGERSEAVWAWAVVESEVRTRLRGFDAMTRATAFRPDGLVPLGSWRGGVRYWNAGRRVPSGHSHDDEPAAEESAARDRPVSYAFDEKGRLLTLEPDALVVLDAPPQCPCEGTRVPFPEVPGFGRMFSTLGASRDGRTVAVARGTQVLLRRAEGLAVVTPPPGLLGPTGPPAPGPANGPRDRDRDRPGRGGPPLNFRALAVAPDGRRLYLADNREHLHVWALDGTRARRLDWPEARSGPWSLALNPDGTLLALGSRTGVVTVLNTADGSTRARLRPATPESEGLVWSLAFSPDGKDLAVGTQHGQVDLWSLSDPTAPRLRLPGHRGSVSALAYDPRGRTLISAGSEKAVDVWDLDRIRDEFARLGLAW